MKFGNKFWNRVFLEMKLRNVVFLKFFTVLSFWLSSVENTKKKWF